MSLFTLGKNNKTIVEKLLSFGKESEITGLCSYILGGATDNLLELNIYYHSIFTLEIPFKGSVEFPVESAIKPEGTWYDWEKMYCDQDNHADTLSDCGRLRRWWAYNLAVAVSNKEKITAI